MLQSSTVGAVLMSRAKNGTEQEIAIDELDRSKVADQSQNKSKVD